MATIRADADRLDGPDVAGDGEEVATDVVAGAAGGGVYAPEDVGPPQPHSRTTAASTTPQKLRLRYIVSSR